MSRLLFCFSPHQTKGAFEDVQNLLKLFFQQQLVSPRTSTNVCARVKLKCITTEGEKKMGSLRREKAGWRVNLKTPRSTLSQDDIYYHSNVLELIFVKCLFFSALHFLIRETVFYSLDIIFEPSNSLQVGMPNWVFISPHSICCNLC